MFYGSSCEKKHEWTMFFWLDSCGPNLYFKFYPDPFCTWSAWRGVLETEKMPPETQETQETAESAKPHSQDQRETIDMEWYGMIWMCRNMRTPSPVFRHFNGQNDDTPSKLRHPLFKQTCISTGDNIISVEDMTRDNGVLSTNRPWTAISPTISESNQKKSWRI
jgi:hypothetical protein